MPDQVRLEASGGRDPEKYQHQLFAESNKYTRKIIGQTGKPYDVIFDLHDNTTHPDVWKYKESILKEDSLGDRTEEGYIVSPLAAQIQMFHCANPKMEGLLKSFRPKIYPKIPYEIDTHGLLTDNTIGLEYYPARLDKWTGELHKLPVTKGLQFLTRLLYHVRDNYE